MSERKYYFKWIEDLVLILNPWTIVRIYRENLSMRLWIWLPKKKAKIKQMLEFIWFNGNFIVIL